MFLLFLFTPTLIYNVIMICLNKNLSWLNEITDTNIILGELFSFLYSYFCRGSSKFKNRIKYLNFKELVH